MATGLDLDSRLLASRPSEDLEDVALVLLVVRHVVALGVASLAPGP